MMNITLRQLKYFEAVAKHRHFGQAADACAVSQPALSVQIRELETTLGVQLFERTARKVRLTGFGEDFRLRVNSILRSIDELEDMARAAQTGFSGRLRLGVIPTIAPYLLPSVLGELMRRYPGLDIHVRETLTSTLVRELLEGKLDAAILALPIDEPTLTEVELFQEDFVLVRPEAQADLPVPSRETLQAMRLLLLEEGHCFRDQALAFCNVRPATSGEGLDGSSLSTLVQMVGAGLGVTLIPEMAIPVETRSAPVSTARFEGAAPSRKIGMIWRRTSPLGDMLSQVADVVRCQADTSAREL